MVCKQCKYMDRCAAEADCLGQVFDLNYDGEHGCVEFEAFTNADRIRAMSDEELAVFLEQTQADVAFNNKSKYAFEWEKWLKQPAEGELQ